MFTAPQLYRDELVRLMITRSDLADLAQLLAMGEIDKVIRLRLLRALRDVAV